MAERLWSIRWPGQAAVTVKLSDEVALARLERKDPPEMTPLDPELVALVRTQHDDRP